MNDILTPLQALEALLTECELSINFSTGLRRAMADAHTSIVSARAAQPAALHDTIDLGAPLEVGDDDCELTFKDLFGEPNPSAFNSKVLEMAQAVAATDGAISSLVEVAHG